MGKISAREISVPTLTLWPVSLMCPQARLPAVPTQVQRTPRLSCEGHANSRRGRGHRQLQSFVRWHCTVTEGSLLVLSHAVPRFDRQFSKFSLVLANIEVLAASNAVELASHDSAESVKRLMTI